MRLGLGSRLGSAVWGSGSGFGMLGLRLRFGFGLSVQNVEDCSFDGEDFVARRIEIATNPGCKNEGIGDNYRTRQDNTRQDSHKTIQDKTATRQDRTREDNHKTREGKTATKQPQDNQKATTRQDNHTTRQPSDKTRQGTRYKTRKGNKR